MMHTHPIRALRPIALTTALLIACLTALPATGQDSEQLDQTATSPRMEVFSDGSLKVGDEFFGSMLEFQQSDTFRDGGHRCSSPGPSELRQVLFNKNAADCSLTSTTIRPQYAPNAGPIYRIPVVFHVIQKTDGTGYISRSMITSQIDILNEDFRALSGSLGGTGVDVRIEFYLADINYVTSNVFFTDPGPGQHNDMKHALHWDTDLYLNIYTNDSNNALGYATFPGQDAGTPQDGVVLSWTVVGRDAPVGGDYDQGRTATHEVGHYFGLFHTHSGCDDATGEYTSGDLIADTNPGSIERYECLSSYTSCNTPDDIENYMGYTPDTCMETFTDEQANRMRCSLISYRPDLFPTCNAGSSSATTETVTYRAIPHTDRVSTTGFFVYYGLENQGLTKKHISFNGSVSCTNSFFGTDPVPGKGKKCYLYTATGWMRPMANEWGSFTVPAGKVSKTYTRSGSCPLTRQCNNAEFGDPAPYYYKECLYSEGGENLQVDEWYPFTIRWLADPQPTASLSCFGNYSGSGQVTCNASVSGGTPPYSYAWTYFGSAASWGSGANYAYAYYFWPKCSSSSFNYFSVAVTDAAGKTAFASRSPLSCY